MSLPTLIVVIACLVSPIAGMLITKLVEPKRTLAQRRAEACKHPNDVEVRGCVDDDLLAFWCPDCESQRYWIGDPKARPNDPPKPPAGPGGAPDPRPAWRAEELAKCNESLVCTAKLHQSLCTSPANAQRR